jgi:hypothetical protein
MPSKADTTNPKDLLGTKKVPMSKVCPIAIAHESLAMLDGEIKYGARNWREKDVIASIYIDAALRHLNAWFEGQEVAEDSGIHHLGHARACLGILLDAQAHGNLIDDRIKGDFPSVAKALEPWIGKRVGAGVVKSTATEPAKSAVIDKHAYVPDTTSGIGFCTVCQSDDVYDGNHIVPSAGRK